MKIIHLTDTHLVEPGRILSGLDPAANLAAAVADINREHPDADLCVLTGDLVNDGRESQYRVLRDILRGLRPPHRLLLGNHDDRGAFRAVFPDAPATVDGFEQGVWDADHARLIFLDTLVPGRPHGQLCAARMAFLRGALDGHAGPVYLFMHHPPVDVGIAGMDADKLQNSAEFWTALAAHRARVGLIAFGHLHRAVWGTHAGVPFCGTPSTNHQVVLEFGRDAVRANRETPAYGIF